MPRLHLACYLGLLERAKVLITIRWKSTTPWKNSLQYAVDDVLTRLRFAVLEGNIDMVEYLLLWSADPRASGRWGNSLVYYAVLFGANPRITGLLLSHGAHSSEALYLSNLAHNIKALASALDHRAGPNSICNGTSLTYIGAGVRCWGSKMEQSTRWAPLRPDHQAFNAIWHRSILER
jgi:hypothetical protein